MAQQSTPNNPKTSVDFLRWVGVFLLLTTAIVGTISIVKNLSVFITIINFGVTFVAILISILQIDKKAFSFISRSWKTGILVIGVFLLLASLSLNVYYFLLPHPTYSPTSTPTPEAANQSSLIPGDRLPTVNDPLADNSQGYAWDQGADSQKAGSCDFVAGAYQISAPAGSSGIGCNMENQKGIFSNLVYQIQMKILEGVNSDNAAACTSFRITTRTQDEVCFSQDGYWSVDGSSGTLASNGTAFPYFASGVNQSNYITIWANGGTFRIQVNGHALGGTYTDPNISSGFLGVNLTPGTSESKVAFSNLRVWTL